MTEQEIFFEAIEIAAADQREAYLRGACGRDVALRRKVDELLAEHFAGDSLLAAPAVAQETLLEQAPLAEGPGSTIGRYKLLQKVGEGGMGVVYMAEQTEPVTRKVALKIIKLGMDTRQVVARFEAERQALAMMDHPNIAKVLDAGATDSGRPYFVMELVRGVPITEYCDKNKLSTHERLGLFLPVCQAIQHAHQKGVIHRDIKPSNVMVTLHDGNAVPKVIDFGIAKATNQKLTEKTLFTHYAAMIGTPAYMSPEQAEMSGLDVDTRTDVYSLGVLLYELLTGTTPFPSKELLSLGYGAMQKVIAEKEPPKPSTRMSTMEHGERTVVAKNRSMGESALGRLFQGDLDWIVMKALEKDRTRRYETVNGLVTDIHRHLNNEPVTAVAPTFGYQLQKFYRRNRGQMRVAAGVAALLVAAAAFATFHAIRATRQERLALRAEAAARRAQQTAVSAQAETRQQWGRSLVEQARALQLARPPGFRTNVWQLLADAQKQPGDLVDRTVLRSIALACLDEPVMQEWQRTHPWREGKLPRILGLTESHVMTGGDDGRVDVTDLQEGRLISTLAGGHSGPVVSAVSRNGRRIVSGGGLKSLWTPSIGAAPIHLGDARGLPVFSADGSRLMLFDPADSGWTSTC